MENTDPHSALPHGRSISYLARGAFTWVEVEKRMWEEKSKRGISGQAAQLGYYVLLLLFPTLLFLTT
jgi:uncharacterized BrkB/YihY/UPF0761 family membrane protein